MNLEALGSFASGMGLALVAALFIIGGLGAGLGLEGRFRRWLLPAMAAIIALASPIGVLADRRDLGRLDFLGQIEAGSASAWALRLSTATVIGLAVVRLVGRLFRTQTRHVSTGQAAPADATHAGLPLLLGFCAYHISNLLLPGAFGTVPQITPQMFYPLLVVGALYSSRNYDPELWLDAVKWSLLAMLVGGFLVSAIAPEITTQFGAREARLPGINYRYWGLGSNPNSIAPLALLLMLLTIHRPFAWRIVTIAALAAGGAVLLLAQSQTTWGAAALVLPPFIVHRLRRRGRSSSTVPDEWTASRIIATTGAIVAVGVVLALLVLELKVGTGMRNDFTSALQASRRGREISDLTGRTQIWMIAIEVWKDSPLFGYGPTIWSENFRAAWNVPFAFHAHNQFMQSLGAAGIVGVLGLLSYLGALVVGALRAARVSRGLAPALVAIMLVRMMTEVPLELSTVLLGDFLYHVTTFVTVLGYLLRAERRRLAPARRRSSSRRRSPDGGRQRDQHTETHRPYPDEVDGGVPL